MCASRRLALACAAGVVALAGLLSGCGGSNRRDRVDAYIREANAVEQRSAPRLARANRTYIAFAQRRLTGTAAATQLAGAERAIRSAREQLAHIRPPADARVLHKRLLHLYDLDAAMAAETTALGRYLPGAQAALKPLSAVNDHLRKGLRASRIPSRQAAALATFARGLARLTGELRDLVPPPVVVPTHRAQIARLERTRSLALRLRGAIEARDAKGVASVLVRFRRLNGKTAGRGAGLEAGAIRAYGRRYEALQSASAAVQRERSRLERELAK